MVSCWKPFSQARSYYRSNQVFLEFEKGINSSLQKLRHLNHRNLNWKLKLTINMSIECQQSSKLTYWENLVSFQSESRVVLHSVKRTRCRILELFFEGTLFRHLNEILKLIENYFLLLKLNREKYVTEWQKNSLNWLLWPIFSITHKFTQLHRFIERHHFRKCKQQKVLESKVNFSRWKIENERKLNLTKFESYQTFWFGLSVMKNQNQ